MFVPECPDSRHDIANFIRSSANFNRNSANVNRDNVDLNRNNANVDHDNAEFNRNKGEVTIEFATLLIDIDRFVKEVANFFNNNSSVVIERFNCCYETRDVVNEYDDCMTGSGIDKTMSSISDT